MDIHPRVFQQLNDERLGSLVGKISTDELLLLVDNPSAQRFLDTRSNNINIIQEVEGRLLRITLSFDSQRIISVGPIRANLVRNRIASGDFIPLT